MTSTDPNHEGPVTVTNIDELRAAIDHDLGLTSLRMDAATVRTKELLLRAADALKTLTDPTTQLRHDAAVWNEGQAAAGENLARQLWEDGDQIVNPYQKQLADLSIGIHHESAPA